MQYCPARQKDSGPDGFMWDRWIKNGIRLLFRMPGYLRVFYMSSCSDGIAPRCRLVPPRLRLRCGWSSSSKKSSVGNSMGRSLYGLRRIGRGSSFSMVVWADSGAGRPFALPERSTEHSVQGYCWGVPSPSSSSTRQVPRSIWVDTTVPRPSGVSTRLSGLGVCFCSSE